MGRKNRYPHGSRHQNSRNPRKDTRQDEQGRYELPQINSISQESWHSLRAKNLGHCPRPLDHVVDAMKKHQPTDRQSEQQSSQVRQKLHTGIPISHSARWQATSPLRLYMPALVASRFNPVLKALYQRLLANGKAKKLALTVLMRKLIILSNRLLKNPQFTLAT